MLLQPKLNVRLAQKQVLTPGLVQMVSVLALNKLELKDMINAEVIENPVLEEIEDNSASFEELAARDGDRELTTEQKQELEKEKDPFDEIDFGSYFQDYLDPGFRSSAGNFEDVEGPGFEHFLSKPSTLSDHLEWQLGAMNIRPELRSVIDVIIGNLNENGYLTASDEELLQMLPEAQRKPAVLEEARSIVNTLDPVGVGARDLRECLCLQMDVMLRDTDAALRRARSNTSALVHSPIAALELRRSVLQTASRIVCDFLPLLQKRDVRELMRLMGQNSEHVNAAVDAIRTLDPRPGQRFNQSETRLIEPDVAFAKRGDDWVVVMNEEDLPALRLNSGYRKMLKGKTTEREVKEYVKERYRSAIQLLRNIEQRKNTIVRTCDCIVRRQVDFLEHGPDHLRPMMIKEVAEEIGVHPSTVSRAVSNKYVHTPQGVYELRYFFSEGVNGPEGGDLPLMLLKKKVRKLIEDEDARKPLTDDALAAELQRQGIQVTRRTVAKYREDMNIPSTHQRRKRE